MSDDEVAGLCGASLPFPNNLGLVPNLPFLKIPCNATCNDKNEYGSVSCDLLLTR